MLGLGYWREAAKAAWVHTSNIHLAKRLFPQLSVSQQLSLAHQDCGLGEQPRPPQVHEEPGVTNINPSLLHQGWLCTWIPDGRYELALYFADKSQSFHFVWVPPGPSEGSVLDARCHVAAKLTG